MTEIERIRLLVSDAKAKAKCSVKQKPTSINVASTTPNKKMSKKKLKKQQEKERLAKGRAKYARKAKRIKEQKAFVASERAKSINQTPDREMIDGSGRSIIVHSNGETSINDRHKPLYGRNF